MCGSLDAIKKRWGLHELAHAYHDQILSFEHPEIIAAYEKAKAINTAPTVSDFDSDRNGWSS